MASRKLTDASPKLQAAYTFSKKAFEVKYPELEVFITCTYRSHEEQNKLYRNASDGVDNDKDGKIDEYDEKVTNAKAGQSIHNYGLAWDIVLLFDKNGDGQLDEEERAAMRALMPQRGSGQPGNRRNRDLII